MENQNTCDLCGKEEKRYRIKTKNLNLGLVPQPWIKTTQHTYKIFKNYFILL